MNRKVNINQLNLPRPVNTMEGRPFSVFEPGRFSNEYQPKVRALGFWPLLGRMHRMCIGSLVALVVTWCTWTRYRHMAIWGWSSSTSCEHLFGLFRIFLELCRYVEAVKGMIVFATVGYVRLCSFMFVRVRSCSFIYVHVRSYSIIFIRIRPCSTMFLHFHPNCGKKRTQVEYSRT